MLNINNNTSRIKREILVKIAKLQLNGTLLDSIKYIPKEMVPENSPSTGCCIYHDREIMKLRVIARLGHSVEDYDEDKSLKEYAKLAMERQKPQEPMLTVLDIACNACVKSHYLITNACQACLARPCMMNCAKKAIHIEKGRAKINEELCVNCGLCMQNCPYHAIIKIPVPCEEACPVNAISKDDNGKERIDYSKCISCGNCMKECPFGAMMDKSQLVDVIKHMMAGKKLCAMYAPAIAAQFRAAPGQLESALLKAGFSEVLEVARGADITAKKEAEEFTERMKRGDKLMTTSCCPAYVSAVKKHVPDLIPCISDTRSPMHYIAEIAKKEHPDSITVFIGPCLAKRREGVTDELVDYVLSAEEIGALFIAKDIDVSQMEKMQKTLDAKPTGKYFAASGGVANAVKEELKDKDILKAAIINGLSKTGMKTLEMYGKIQSGKIPQTNDSPNLVEVMSCEGGCISGPLVITNPKIAAIQLKKYVES